MTLLTGKHAVITGGSDGIGLGIARAFAMAGAEQLGKALRAVLQMVKNHRLPFTADQIHRQTERTGVHLAVQADEIAHTFFLHIQPIQKDSSCSPVYRR